MARTLMICITILLIVTLLNVVSGGDFTGVTQGFGVDGEVFINGSSTRIATAHYTMTFGIDAIQGAIIWFVGIVAVCIIGE